MKRVVLVSCVVWALGVGDAHQTAPQEQRPVFRAGTDVSQLMVRVLNERDRTPVRDLTAADFNLLINGVPQPIVAVYPEDVAGPVTPSAPWMRDVASDIATNSIQNPRLIVIILDDALFGADPRDTTGNCRFSGLKGDPWSLKETKAIAGAIINELGPSDLATVVFTADNSAPQDFTRDRARLLAAVNRFHSTGIPCGLALKYSAGTLIAARAFLGEVPDRASAILWISPGFANGDLHEARLIDRDVAMADLGQELSVRDQLSQLVGQSRISSVPIYPISNVGLLAPGDEVLAAKGKPALTIQQSFGHTLAFRDIAIATGGRAIQDTNAPHADVPAIFLENSFRYIVGYRMTQPEADGKYRRLKVIVNRKGVIVEPSDRIFLAPTAEAVAKAAAAPKADATTRALSGIIPVTDEPLRLAVAAFGTPAESARSGNSVPVTVVLSLDLPPAMSVAGANGAIELETRVFDGEGRVQLDLKRETVRLSTTPSRARGQYDLLSMLSLKPGRYNLRFSTHSAARGKSGSVYTDITVPDFAKEPFSLSGVAVSVSPGRFATPATALAGILPLVPTTSREFSADSRVRVFLRAYWGGNKPADDVVMSAKIFDTQNATVFERTDTLTPAQPTAPRTADYHVDLPLTSLVAGEYVLSMRASSSMGSEIHRDVRFVVR